jgi:hypothetical protein
MEGSQRGLVGEAVGERRRKQLQQWSCFCYSGVMKNEVPPQSEAPEQYSSEWLTQMLEEKRQSAISTWEAAKTNNPKDAGYNQKLIGEWQNAPEGEWTYRFFANMAHNLGNRDWLIWGTDEERQASLKNMPGGDEVRARAVQKWKDLRTTLEKLNLSKERIHQFEFRRPFTPEEIDTLGHVYYEMKKMGYEGEELGTFW